MREIDFYAGCNIEDAYKQMKRCAITTGRDCFGMFNGKKLLSTYTLDECYKKVTGLTKSEYEEKRAKEREEYLRKEAEFKESIPKKVEEYKEKAIGIIPDDKIERWNEIVPIRLNDLYRGMELDCWLELVAELNKDIPKEEKFEKCKEMFMKQGHSGMSASLVRIGLKEFHELGEEFVEYCNGDL